MIFVYLSFTFLYRVLASPVRLWRLSRNMTSEYRFQDPGKVKLKEDGSFRVRSLLAPATPIVADCCLYPHAPRTLPARSTHGHVRVACLCSGWSLGQIAITGHRIGCPHAGVLGDSLRQYSWRTLKPALEHPRLRGHVLTLGQCRQNGVQLGFGEDEDAVHREQQRMVSGAGDGSHRRESFCAGAGPSYGPGACSLV